jgi:hypothetical protein
VSFEPLEGRRLLSFSVTTVQGGWVSPDVPPSSNLALAVLAGKSIYAQAGQPFRAALGTIRGLQALPSMYHLAGTINWGDGSVPSPASFAVESNGVIDVLGAHTYGSAGSDAITVTVVAAPPPGSLAPVLLIGTINAKAQVIAPNGGVTLSATAGVEFTSNLGTFRTTQSMNTLTANIDWGDGTQSVGKIVALPTAGPLAGGLFAVYGTHTYGITNSYLVQVTVTSTVPPPVTATGTVPPTIVVAQFDSVIDVLPPSPTAVLA